MALLTTVKYMLRHPLNRGAKLRALSRFVKWQISSRLMPLPVIYPLTERAKLIIRRGMTGATGNLYNGLHEFNDMGFLLHFLRKEDLFVDIGANIGVYSALAGAHVQANVLAFEPVPSTYSNLINNIRLNNMESKVTAHNMALGSGPDVIDFTSTLDTVNHVAVSTDRDTIKVKVDSLDSVLEGRHASLIKIDVEGFETEVIKGAENLLECESLKGVIIELNGSGDRYGYNEKNIHEKLLTHGFVPYIYDPSNRSLVKVDNIGTYNTIYLRDLSKVKDRLHSAEKFRIRNHLI